MKKTNQKFYDFVVSEDKKTADLYIFGDIIAWRWFEEDVSAGSFQKDLEAIGQVDTLNVHINSCGGDVFEGIAIYNLIKNYNAVKNVYIDGIAASIASVIAMAGDNIYMSNTSVMMIHNCWTWASGNAEDLRKTADDMDKVMQAIRNAYLSKVNIDEDKLKQLLDDESYLLADECIEMGFCSEIIEYDEEEKELSASSRGYYDLVMKVKKLENNQAQLTDEEKPSHNHCYSIPVILSEAQMNDIINRVVEEMSKKDSGNDPEEPDEDKPDEEEKTNNDLNSDSIVSRFLNKFLEEN